MKQPSAPWGSRWIGQRVEVPGGRLGTVVGVRVVEVQLDGVASLNTCEVSLLTFLGPEEDTSHRPDGVERWSCADGTCAKPESHARGSSEVGE